MEQPSLAEFITEATRFVSAHYPSLTAEESTIVTSDRITVIPERTQAEEEADLVEARRWRAAVDDAGFGWPDGPVQHGGRGLGPEYAAAYREVESAFTVPDEGYTRFSIGICTPTLLEHGSTELQDRYLRPLRRAELVACQLFSEPEAGSDLASARTRAVRDGGGWLLTGQKVWTSGAHYSEIGMVLARTGDADQKHAGLSVFMIDMRQPGVEIRPIKQMTGGASFNEVFLDGARVEDWARLGEVGGGWRVITTTLRHERAVIGSDGAVDLLLVPRLVELARRCGREDDAGVRGAIAEIHVRAVANQKMTARYLRLAGAGGAPGPEMSLSKLLLTDNLQRISELAQDLLGGSFTADTGQWGTFGWNQLALTLPGLRIGGGTDEVLRTIVAQRVLGLPRAG